MKDILPDLDRWQRTGEAVALATLVAVQRSAPRPPGARMAVTRGGAPAGSIAGGCVEGDLYERALEVLDTGRPALVHYGIADDLAFQVGLSCGGAVDVLVEPFVADAPWEAVRQAVERQQAAALAVALSPTALIGRRSAVVGDGETVGAIDPALDQAVVSAARQLILDEGTRVLSLPWRGQETSVFIEAFLPQPHLLIVGATHAAIVLTQMAKQLGFRVTVIDARSLFATPERFPDADALLRVWPDEALAGISLDRYSYVVILTHDPKFDLPTLAYALRSPTRYIGAMGSRTTHEGRKQELRRQGFGDADFGRIHAPIGLDLGARSPEEVAVAILAEIVAVRNGRKLKSERTGPAAGVAGD
jgi:xanthine dehydrogenase accessory factor